MRFRRLCIPAFGPFTNLELSFPSQEHDLHVIYGENEVGKSSLLRAIRDLLFGIHPQSPDNFLHDYKNIRLLAEIENRKGERLIFQRRKGNKNTLIDEHGNPLPDKALVPFLGSIDKAYFSAMFGLGSSELREGAVQLLRGEGEIGSALFSASLGGTPIQRVLDGLDVESERLFKGKATANVSIRPSAARYKELLKQSRDSTVSAEIWDQLEKDLADQESAKKCLEDEIAGFDRELAWVSRCEDALPSIGRLNEEMRLFNELPELPQVASDFVERARAARSALSASSDKVQILNNQITQLEHLLSNCVLSPAVLADAGTLDTLHQDLSAHREQKSALMKLKGKLSGIEPVLRSGMTNLEVSGELNALEQVRLSSVVRMCCEEAANVLQSATRNRDECRSKADELKAAIVADEKELKLLPETDLTPLRESLAEAAGAIEADKTLMVSRTAVENLMLKVAAEQSLLFDAPEDPDTASRLPVPSPTTIRKFRDLFASFDRDIKQTTKLIRDEQNRLNTFEDELRRLERRGELPSEVSLWQARNHRDHGWQLVLADWKGDGAKEDLEPGSPLDEAFPRAIIQADLIADQLRLNAESVAQAEEKRLQIRNSTESITKANETLASLQISVKECQNLWEAEWARTGVHPRSPDEMEEWRENWVRFRELTGKLREAEVSVSSKETQVQHARTTLAAALMDSEEKQFSVLFEAARIRVQQGEESTGRRNAIGDRLENLKKELQRFERKSAGLNQAVETAEANWKLQCQAAGLSQDTTPNSGLRLLQDRKDLLTKFDTWKEFSGETDMLADAIERYEQTVCEKAASFGIEAGSTDAQESRLWNALTQARAAQAEHDQLTSQIRSGTIDLTAARQMEQLALQTMEELLSLSNLSSQEELEPLLANLEKRTALQNQIDGLRETLSGLARGQGVDDFISRVQAENAEDLPERIGQLEKSKTEKTSSLQQVQAALIGLHNEKKKLEKAGDAAADYRQQAETVVSTLRQDVSRFLRLRLAAHFLRTQIERFREENQGPLLEKSGQVFKQITRNAFDGLQAEIDDDDTPVMVGRKSSGDLVPVDGMSDGTLDQLYLALRLAAMDRYLEEHEPMPLILDDLLITCDNQRAKAVLPQLAQLAKRTQIFLFTHHEHLVDLCRETVEGQFMVQHLGTGAG